MPACICDTRRGAKTARRTYWQLVRPVRRGRSASGCLGELDAQWRARAAALWQRGLFDDVVLPHKGMLPRP